MLPNSVCSNFYNMIEQMIKSIESYSNSWSTKGMNPTHTFALNCFPFITMKK